MKFDENIDLNFDYENESFIATGVTNSINDYVNGQINIKNKNVLNSIEAATKITKNLFDTSNTKLNMDIFDQIDFG